MKCISFALGVLFSMQTYAAPSTVAPVQATAAKASPANITVSPKMLPSSVPMASDSAISLLKPGQWIWSAEAVPEGPMLMMVSIPQQRAYLYRNGVRVAASTVSTGKKGHETPTGIFTILQKNKDHKSSLYDDAPMPFMQRLTWDGIALHSGKLPGYPASHGCVRLPDDFAKRLFAETELGMTVIVSNVKSVDSPVAVANSDVFAQSIDSNGQTIAVPPLSWYEDFRWQPEKSQFGPVTIVISTKNHTAIVLRNGIEIGRSKVGVVGNDAFGNQAYLVLEGQSKTQSRIVPGQLELNWLRVSADVNAAPSLGLDGSAIRRIVVPVDFAKAAYNVLRPGSSMLLTDEEINLDGSAQGMTVLSDETDEEHAKESE